MSQEVEPAPPGSTIDAAVLQRLHELTVGVEEFESTVERLLSLGCDHFGLETGILSDIDGDRYEIEAVVDSTGTYETGSVSEFGETMCRVTVASESTETVAFADVTETEYSTHPAASDSDVRAYIAAPVLVDGEVYGTVNFSSRTAREERVRDSEREFVRLVAGWIGNEIERRRRQIELERYEQMVDAADEMMYAVDEDGRFRVANEALVEYCGTDKETIVGSTEAELVERGILPADVPAQRREAVSELGDSGCQQTTVEFEHEADGTRAFECRVARTDDGESTYVSVIRDVTERTEDERQLETEQEWQEAVFEGSRDAIFISDPEAAFVDVNAAATDLTGYDREELLSMRIPDLHEQTDLETYREYHDRILAGEPATVEAELRRADGSKISVELSSRRIQVDGDIYMHTVARDVTERKHRERELKEYETLVNAAEDPMFAVTSDMRFSLVNDRFLELAGIERDEIVGKPATELVEHDIIDPETLVQWESAYEQLARIDDDKLVTEIEADLWAEDDGFRVFEAHIAMLEDDEKHSVTICRDITGRKERETELRQERNRLSRLKEVVTSIQPLTEEITAATSRDDVEAAVCRGLADSPGYTSAWIGAYSELRDRVHPRASAGLPEASLDAVDDVDQSDTPVARAIVTGQPQVVEDAPGLPPFEQERDGASPAGNQSVAVVPLVHRSTVHGVLVVCSVHETAVQERELAVLAGLGRLVGYAISAVKHRQLLQSDSLVELQFRASPPDRPPFSVASTCDCTLRVRNLAVSGDDGCLFHLCVEGCEPSCVEAALADLSAVVDVRTLRAEADAGVLQCELTGANPLGLLVDHGAVVQSACATAQETTIAVEMAPAADVRAVVEAVESTFSGLEFVSQREREAADERLLLANSPELWASLTDRQQQVVEAAYHAGYYDWPRKTTAEQLADALGVSAPTLHQHVRKAHHSLIAGLVEGNVVA